MRAPKAYTTAVTGGALIVAFACQMLLRFPSPELLTSYRPSPTATPLGGFALAVACGLGIGLARLEVDNSVSDVRFMLWVSLLVGSIYAACVACRNSNPTPQDSQDS